MTIDLKPLVLSAIWVVGGAIEIADSVTGLKLWQGYGGRFAHDAWTVWGFGAAGGAIAILCGLLLWFRWRGAAWFVRAAAVLVGLYFLAYLILGGEGSVWARIIVPIAVLILCYETFRTAGLPRLITKRS